MISYEEQTIIEEEIKAHVALWGKGLLTVPPNGYCIINSFYLALNELLGENYNLTPSGLLDLVKTEMLQHSDHYAPYMTNTTKFIDEINDYENYGDYNSNTVDLFLHALANSTQTSVNIIQKQNNTIESLIIPPARVDVAPQQMIILSRVANHYSPIVDLATLTESKTYGHMQGLLPIRHSNTQDVSSSIEVLSDSDMSENHSVSSESDSDCSSASEDTLTNIYKQGNKTYLPTDVWKDVKVEYVEKLPHDINGSRIYILPYDTVNPMRNTTDGRDWKRYMASKRRGFSGVRRMSQCSGSNICKNETCPYQQEYADQNVSEFHKDSRGKLTCIHCGTESVRLHCSARKIWEINSRNQETKIYHYGRHTCKIQKKKVIKTDEIKDKFKENIYRKPEQLIRGSIIDALQTGKPWEEVLEVADTMSDKQYIRNQKKLAKTEIRPHGHSFEAVAKLKETTDKHDHTLIYRCNDGRLNDKPTYVFKSSRLKAKIANNMNREKSHFMSEQYAHFDGKADRCKGFTTLCLSAYHPVLRKMIPLAIMECMGETTKNVTLFFQLFNDIIKSVSEEQSAFNPIGFITDEAGANIAGLVNVFGDTVKERLKGCEFHFLQSVQRHCVHLVSRKSKRKFKKLANDLRTVSTPLQYDQSFRHLTKFIEDKPQKRAALQSWLQWWDSRKIRWARAYSPSYKAPAANQAEAVNASFTNTGSCGRSLVDAAYDDVAESILLERMWEKHKCGAKMGTMGPTSVDLSKREEAVQTLRSADFCKDIETLLNKSNSINDDIPDRSELITNSIIDPTSSHRPTKPTKRKKTWKQQNNIRKKARISIYDSSSHDLSTSSDNEPTGGRPRVHRTKRSNMFMKSLERAKHEKENIKVLSYQKHARNLTVELKAKYSSYSVEISSLPNCNCPFKQNRARETCKHLIWVLINLLGISEDNDMLQQIGFSENELKMLIDSVPVQIPPHIKHSETVCTTDRYQEALRNHPGINREQEWFISRKSCGKPAKCAGCFERKIVIGDLHIAVKGLFVTDALKVVETTWRYCIDRSCVKKSSRRSSIRPKLDGVIYMDPKVSLSRPENELVKERNFTLRLKINI